jgi:uncharacterized membrane protein
MEAAPETTSVISQRSFGAGAPLLSPVSAMIQCTSLSVTHIMNPARSSRLVFIDWLRGFSILFMIETHAFNSLLKPFLKEEGWFHVLNFFNGLMAPSFLFVLGISLLPVRGRWGLPPLQALFAPAGSC